MTKQSVLNSVEEVLEDIRQGKVVIVVDDEDRENEGDFIVAAEKITPEIVNFMLHNGRGVMCAPLTEDRCKELELDMQVTDNTSLLGTPFTMLATGMNPFINAQGRPKIGMMTTVIGAVLNLALDPLFIYGFHMGVTGAAVATVISQAVSCIWVLRFLSGPKSILPLRRREARIYPYLLKDILSLGVVGFIMKFTNSLVQIACNKMLSIHGGDLYVGVMTVINAIRDVFTLPASGITDGARPVLSYNYGAGQMQRVRAGIRFMSAAAMVYTFCAWLFAMFQPRLLCRIFTPDEAMVEASVRMLRVYFAGFFFQSFQFCGQSVFQSLGWAKYAITFSLLRKVVIVVPLTLLLPVVGLGTTGVFLAEPISNIVGGLACYITMLCTAYKQMGRE